jgi:hypothetical protein
MFEAGGLNSLRRCSQFGALPNKKADILLDIGRLEYNSMM